MNLSPQTILTTGALIFGTVVTAVILNGVWEVLAPLQTNGAFSMLGLSEFGTAALLLAGGALTFVLSSFGDSAW